MNADCQTLRVSDGSPPVDWQHRTLRAPGHSQDCTGNRVKSSMYKCPVSKLYWEQGIVDRVKCSMYKCPVSSVQIVLGAEYTGQSKVKCVQMPVV